MSGAGKNTVALSMLASQGPPSMPSTPRDGSTVLPDSRMSNRPLAVRLEYSMYIGYLVWLFGTTLYQLHTVCHQPDALQFSRHELSPPWFFPSVFSGVDFSDGQWGSFFNNLPVLTAVFLAFAAVGRWARSTVPATPEGSTTADGGALPTRVLLVHLVFSLGVLAYMHGPYILFVLGLYLVNYAWSRLHRTLPFKLYNGGGWLLLLTILFANELHNGYRFASIAPSLAWLDEYGLASPIRWHVVFNMSMLRLVAWNYDTWEAASPKAETTRLEAEAKHANTCADCNEFKAPCYRLRTTVPRPTSQYTLLAYLAYLTYVPLYVGGPLTGFNAYASHVVQPQKAFDVSRGLRYLGRILGLGMTLVLTLHIAHINMIRKDGATFSRLTTFQLMGFALWSLAFLWLKFNTMWKFFRLAGMLEGVESPEDMNRCFGNTVTVADFWRDWHSSFNLWIVRYMYVPLGGNKTKHVSIFPIFLFIALWHDIQLHLLWWAAIMCVAFLPELVVGAWFAKNCKWMRDRPYYRHVRALGASMSTLSLVVANMFGFGAGLKSKDGVEALGSGIPVLLGAFGLFFSANNIGLQERATRDEAELRRKHALGLLKGN